MRNNKAIIYSDTKTQLDGGGFNYVQAVNDFLIAKGFETMVLGNEEVKSRSKHIIWQNIFKIFPIIKTLKNAVDDLFQYKVVVFKNNFIPSLSFNNHSILLVDFPFQHQLDFTDRLKLKSISHLICNSSYTASWIKQYWGVDAQVIYPTGMVSAQAQAKHKKKQILSVGRFLSQGRSKRQDILIHCFKALYDKGMRDYTLYLAGFVQDKETLKELKTLAQNYPIEFKENASKLEIQSLYEDATFYWHACGYGADLKQNPSAAEHYGIAVADALTFGCVTMVYGIGGPAEIVGNGSFGEVWFTPEELEQKMSEYLNNAELVNTMAEKARNRSSAFSEAAFNSKLEALLKL